MVRACLSLARPPDVFIALASCPVSSINRPSACLLTASSTGQDVFSSSFPARAPHRTDHVHPGSVRYQERAAVAARLSFNHAKGTIMSTLPSPSPIDVTKNNDERASFRRQLEEQLREREELVAELHPRAAPHIDLVAWSTTQSALQVVAQINAALLRIEAGTFGTCSRCARPIAKARLKIIPYADTCVPCHADGTS